LAEAPPQTPLGSSQHSRRLRNWILRGPTFKGKERRKRGKDRERDGSGKRGGTKGKKGGEGKGDEAPQIGISGYATA